MSDNEWDFDSDAGSEAGESSSSQEWLKPPQLLVGIDTHPSMFTKTEEGLHAFHSCLLGMYSILDQLLLRSDQKTIAVILAHDSESKAVFFDFDTSVIEKLVIMKKVLDMRDEDIKSEYMRTGKFDFASFLLLAKKQFQKATTETRTRTFLYITNDSNPVGNDAKAKFRALNEALNFPALKIRFELATMSPSFTWNDFYEEMYKAMDVSLVKELCEDEDGVVDKILPVVEPSMRLRSIRFFPAVGNEKIFMKVHVDSVVHRPKVALDKKFTRDRHEELRQKMLIKPIVSEKTAIVRKDVKLTVTTEEAETLKSSQYPIGYALLGVVKRQMSRPEIYIKKHDLMFANKKDECDYFNTFWKYCVEKERVLFCSYRHLKRCYPYFCEMIPTIMNNKCCFLIKYLYFLDDYLIDPELPFDDDEEEPVSESISDATVNDIRKLVDALTFPYDPNAFYDVQNAKEEAYVKAQALDQPLEDVEDIVDNKSKMNKVLDDLGVIQKRVAEVKDEKLSQQSQSSKKPKGGTSRKNASKKK